MLFDSMAISLLYAGFIFLSLLQRKFFPGVGWRQVLLLAADFLILSLLIPVQTAILISATAILVFGAARLLQSGRLKRALPFLIGCIILLVAGLAVLKYDWPKQLISHFRWAELSRQISLVGVIGISYIFFKLLHLLVDAYRGGLPRLNFLTFINYLFFFPTYISGPIDRYQNFSRWLAHRPGNRDHLLWRAAFFRIFWGALKKMVLVPFLVGFATDFTQVHISPVYWVNVMCSLFAYSFYIYFDFSGYSDLAIGSAMLLGFKVPENFHTPYLAPNIGDFWRRWHISLSSILREYIFLPLVRGISQHFPRIPRVVGTIIGYLITFFICGLWHGNTVNFAIWGLWHGIGLSIHRIWRDLPINHRLREGKNGLILKMVSAVTVIITFCYISFGWFFFTYSFQQLQTLQLLSRLQVTAQPYYYYGDFYTWGIKLKYKPITKNDRMDVDFRSVTSEEWITYTSDMRTESGFVNVYGAINPKNATQPYDSLLPGSYQIRLRYQAANEQRSRLIMLPVTIPDYTGKSAITADDMEARAYRYENGWGIRITYRPPSNKFTTDIEIRTPQKGKWASYQLNRPGYHHSAVIRGPGNAGLKPGVYCVRIRYINVAEGYFGDWTQQAVRVTDDPGEGR